MSGTPGDEAIEVECLSCNARSEATSQRAIGPTGDWQCPECGGYVAAVAGKERSAGP